MRCKQNILKKKCMVFYICSFSSFLSFVLSQVHKHTHFFASFFFLDVDNQIIMKQCYHITETCKTSSSEELIFRETGTRKKVQWKRSYHLWVFRVHCTVMRTDKTRTQASLQSEPPYRVSLLQSMCSVLEEYMITTVVVFFRACLMQGLKRGLGQLIGKHGTSILNSYS